MNLNRCERCGSFFASKNSVCPNCQSKDEHEINHLKTFLSEADSSVTVESLAESTGVSLKNVNRFLQDKNIHYFNKLRIKLRSKQNTQYFLIKI